MLAEDAAQRRQRDTLALLQLRRPPEIRRFDPSEPRRPDGKWGSGGVVKDALKLAGRIQLGKDEQLAGSDFVDLGDMGTAMAVTKGPNGPHLRLGMIYGEDKSKWSGANKGGTIILDPAEVDSLHDKLAAMGAVADKRSAEIWASYDANKAKQRELNAQIHKIVNDAGSDANGMPNLNRDQLAKIKDLQKQAIAIDEHDYSGEPEVDETFAKATIPAQWGDLALSAEGRDDEHNRWGISMDVARPNAEPFGSDYPQLDAKSLPEFLRRLAAMRAVMADPTSATT